MNETTHKSSERIIEELKNISPLNLPEYIMECEFYDMEEARDILEKAVAEFEDKGGLAQNLVEPVIYATANSVLMLGLKKFNKKIYDDVLKGKVNLGAVVNKAINFKYPDGDFFGGRDEASILRNEILHNQLRNENSGVNKKYTRSQYDSDKRKNEFKDKEFDGEKKVKDVLGKDVYRTQKDAENAGKDKHKDTANTDHVVPLSTIHKQYGGFVRRYSGQENIRDIANDDKNYQLLNQADNSPVKNDGSNKDMIEKMESGGKDLPPESKKALIENQKGAEKYIQQELLKSGAKTVGIEQIGRVLETLIGPLSFEMRDMIANGMEHEIDCENGLEALWKRVCRMMRYVAEELPRLLGDFFADLGQMLTHLALSIFGVIKALFGKFFDVVVNGLSTIKEAIKILSSKQYETSAKKADAIAKLVVALVVGVAGQFIIDMVLKLPPTWSEVVAALISSVLSAIVIYFFNKLDLFGASAQVRNARIKEIFDERIASIKHDTENFDLAVTERLRAHRIKFEEYKVALTEKLADKDFLSLTVEIQRVADFFKVDLPYSTSDEFVQYVKSNEQILIGY